jgi:hypothetical protein
MPFNGSGTFTLPAGNPVISGTPADSTVHNNTNSEIAVALTNCVTRDGQSPATADLPMGGFKLTGVAAATAAGQYLEYTQRGKQTFTANGNFTVPAGITTIYVSACAGGGGGGGGGSNNIVYGIASGGGGGGAGQWVYKKAYTVVPASVIAITVGTGGNYGIGGIPGADDATAGANGTDTVIGALVTLTHGSGGARGLQATGAPIGSSGGAGYPAGGSSSTGGTSGGYIYAGFSGTGASTPFGQGGLGVRAVGSSSGLNGNIGFGYGSGGGGGGISFANPGTGVQGESGAPGIVIIEW